MQEKRIPRSEYPGWVKLSLWGLPNRASVWFFVWLSLFAALACGIYGFRDPRFFLGLGLIIAALLYWLAIKWVDRYGSW